MGSYWSVHSHSELSHLDGMGSVADMVATVADLGQPALALTDHGHMAGAIKLYKACQRHGLAAYPGSEMYLVRSFDKGELPDGTKYDDRKQRYHIGVLALDLEGWKALVQLSSLSHQRDHFHIKPLITLPEFLEWGERYGDHVAVTTGCYFGWVIQHLLEWDFDIDRTTTMVGIFAASFPHLFVEVQNHKIIHDRVGVTDGMIAACLLEIAKRLGLPVVAGQDSHYCDAEEKPVHDLMKSIAYLGGNGEDNVFPGDSFHLADEAWMRDHHWSWWDRVVEGHEHLLDLHNLVVPALDGYRFRVPDVGKDPDAKLAAMMDAAAANYDLQPPGYDERIQEELDVIRATGMAGYFLIVADYCQWSRDQGIVINARGSANGSLVCYLLGITEVDPLVWGTEFDRFLSLDRQKPPDVDLDVESDRRDDVVNYLRSRYPSLTQIGTWTQMGISDDAEQKGSVFVQWHAAKRSRGEDSEIPPEDVKLLRRLDVTAVRKGYGSHAGGFVLPGADLAIEDLLATMLIASSGHTVTQAPMEDVEEAGYVKVDLLGLRSLTTVRRVLELIGKDPVKDGLGWIPLDDPAACRILRSGVAENGIFQFEGFSTARGGRQLGVKSTADAIITLALYRPALMNGGQQERYLHARKTGKRETIHPTVDDLFMDTMGVPVWQEDVLNLMRRVGLGVDDRNAILKAVKSSNDRIAQAEKTFARVHPIFVLSAMDTLGVDSEAGERMWATVMEFTDYGFNKAHATAYGLLAYRMAWLKAHHPTEFMAALLDTWAGTDKEPKYIAEAHRLKMTVHRPDINRSGAGWKIDGDGKLRRGFRSIHGIGEAGAVALAELAPYVSLDDLCERVPGRAVPGSKAYLAKKTKGEIKGAIAALRDAGALKSLGIDKEE